MSDGAFNLLLQQFNADDDELALWLVDENISPANLVAVQPTSNLSVMTNRYDLHRALTDGGFNARLLDYDFSSLEKSSLDVIYYRVSKEKAVVHHIINNAGEYLKPGGCLVLAGHKNEGVKTYIDKAAHYLGGEVEKIRGSSGVFLARLFKAGVIEQKLDDKNYRQQTSVAADDCDFITKPGVYGWNKVDKGSAFLIANLPRFIAENTALNSTDDSVLVADLGCGYGYLSVMASRILAGHYLATDNNVAAVAMCQQNFSAQGVNGVASIGDCGSSIDQQVDLVLCNPPFHQGFEVTGDLTLKFLQASHRILKRGGTALFVVNSFIAVGKKAKGLFATSTMLENNGSFKLMVLKK